MNGQPLAQAFDDWVYMIPPTTAQRLRVPFFRPTIEQIEIDEVVACLRSGCLTAGPRLERFEASFAGFVGAKHAVAVNTGAAVLHLAVDAMKLGPGQVVLIPAMSFLLPQRKPFFAKAPHPCWSIANQKP